MLRAIPVTINPLETASFTKFEPTIPVAPITAIFIIILFYFVIFFITFMVKKFSIELIYKSFQRFFLQSIDHNFVCFFKKIFQGFVYFLSYLTFGIGTSIFFTLHIRVFYGIE